MRRWRRAIIDLGMGSLLVVGCVDPMPPEVLTTGLGPGATTGSGDDGSSTLPADGTSVGDDADGSGDDGTVPLPCDPGFSFDPDPPGSGTITWVGFTDPSPLTFVEMEATGPGVASRGSLEIAASDPWTWRWPFTDLAPGIWTFTFSHGEPPVTLGSCQREVLDTGLPPDLPGDPPPPTGDCGAGQVCGDAGPGGGTCDYCPMVGDCLDPPSPYGPSGPGDWSCLDSAGCNEGDGVCRIWCPGEPCNEEAHPDGCPQGVETCFVSATFTSYEEACASCCESRFHEPTGEYACWDPAFNLCRYPTDCGLPLW